MVQLYWEDWNSSLIETYLELVIQPLCGIIIIILFIIFIHIFICNKKLCYGEDPNYDIKHPNGIKYNSLIKFYIGLLFVSFIMSILNIFGNLWFSNLQVLIYNVRYDKGCFYRTTLNITMVMQRVIAYYFFINRLRITFEGSVFEMRNIVYYLFIAFIVVTSFIQYGVIMILTYYYTEFRCSSSGIVVTGIIICLICDTIVNLSITGLFVIKLKGLIDMLKHDFNTYTKNTHNLRIVVIKLTILCLNAVIFTLVLSVLIGNVFIIMPYQWYGIDLLINNACMMLSFAILDYQFNKLCYCCVCISNKCFKQFQYSQYKEMSMSLKRHLRQPIYSI